MTDEEFKRIVETFAKASGVFKTKGIVDSIVEEMSVNKYDIDDSFVFEPMRKKYKNWK